MRKNIYAIYKGDTFLFEGTGKQCAEFLNVKPDTIKFRTTPAYKRRVKGVYENRQIIIKIGVE